MPSKDAVEDRESTHPDEVEYAGDDDSEIANEIVRAGLIGTQGGAYPKLYRDWHICRRPNFGPHVALFERFDQGRIALIL